MVEALAPHRAEEPLTSSVDQRRAYRALDDSGAGSASYAIEVHAELAVSVTDDELRAFAEWSRVAELLRHPSRSGGARNAHLNDALRVHVHDEEREDGQKPQVASYIAKRPLFESD